MLCKPNGCMVATVRQLYSNHSCAPSKHSSASAAGVCQHLGCVQQLLVSQSTKTLYHCSYYPRLPSSIQLKRQEKMKTIKTLVLLDNCTGKVHLDATELQQVMESKYLGII